jgi:hypothetical protein
VTAALYATMYAEDAFYVDAVANYLRSGHDSRRHIVYSEAGAPVEFTADGATNGTFREHGAAGLDLAFEEQDYVFATATAKLRISYASKPMGLRIETAFR